VTVIGEFTNGTAAVAGSALAAIATAAMIVPSFMMFALSLVGSESPPDVMFMIINKV
jgi:hypothetical protein